MGLGIERLPSFDDWRPDVRANYGGSGRKSGLIGPDGARYMVKYADKRAPCGDLATSYVNKAVSEYVSSHVLGLLGYPVHETELGTLGGEVVVACRNFVPAGGDLIEFEKFMRRRYNSHDIGKAPGIGRIYEIFETDPILLPQAGRFKSCYWERFVGDALVGNPSRYAGDFGYLIGSDDSVSASPVYDNGDALYPDLSEEGMRAVLDDPKEIMTRVKLFPKAALEMQGKKAGYYDMMASGIYDELTEAVISTVPRIRDRMPAVREFIDSRNFLSDTRKDFYKIMLAERMAFVLEPAYEKCVFRQFDQEARKRLEAGAGYTMEDFERYWKRGGSSDGRAAADIRNGITKGTFESPVDVSP